MRTRDTEGVLSLDKDPKEKLADAIKLSIRHCQNKIAGKSEGKFPLCISVGRNNCNGHLHVDPCPVYIVTGKMHCMYAPIMPATQMVNKDFCKGVKLTTRQRRHFRKLHWCQMLVLLEAIRDQKVGT